MPTSTFPTLITGVTVETATTGALSGDGSSGDKLAVEVDGVTIEVNASNELGIPDSVPLTTPDIGAATGVSVVLSGDAKAATFHVGAAAGIDASITTATLVAKTITVTKGLITGFA